MPDVQQFNSEVLGLRSANEDTVEALVLNQQAFRDWMAEEQNHEIEFSTAAAQRLITWREQGRTFR
jgi:predicted phage tail protein